MKKLIPILMAALAAGGAFALPQKLNLREKDKILAELAAKENNEKLKPGQRAAAGFERRQFETWICEDKDLPAKEKALEDFIANPGLGDADYVAFLFETCGSAFPLRRPEFFRLAEKTAMASTNADARAGFYTRAINHLTPGAWTWCSNESCQLVPEFSPDARLALVERAEKDPLLAKHRERGWINVAGWRIDSLKLLGRFDEAEKILRTNVENATDNRVKMHAATALAKFYEERAYRWYDDPSPVMLRKAAGIWELAEALGNGGARAAIIEIGVKLGDAKLVRKWADRDTAAQKDKTPTAATVLALANVAYMEKNWREAADLYARYPADRCDWRTLHKMAGAFRAAGDGAKALEYVKLARKRCNNGYERPHLDAEIAVLEGKAK